MKFKIKSILFFFIVSSTITLCAQTYNIVQGGATTNSIGGITSLLKGVDAIYHNPAAQNYCDKKTSYDISFENKYNISGLNNIGIGGLRKIGLSTIGLALNQYGISEYNTKKIALSYSRSLLENFSFGIKFNYNNLTIKDYGNTNYFSSDIGLFTKINKQLNLSGHIANIAKSKNKADNDLTNISIGLTYMPSDKVFIMTEFYKVENRPLSPKIAFVYNIDKAFEIRVGSDIGRAVLGFGVGYKIGNYRGRVGYSSHQQLGGSYGISLQGG